MVDAKTSLADELSFSELTALCGFRAISCLERFPAFTALKLLGFTEAEFSFENELRQNQGTAVADTSLEYKIPCIKFPHKTTRSLLLYFPLFCGILFFSRITSWWTVDGLCDDPCGRLADRRISATDASLGNPPSRPVCSLISIYRLANKLLVVGLDQLERSQPLPNSLKL